MNTPDPRTLDAARMSRARQAALPLSADVAQALAEQHGVCIRPLAMHRIDTTTGRVEVVPVPCGSTRADQCPPCAEKARRLRMAQCREGWHLDTEPVIDRAKPDEDHKALMATRADLLAAYAECKTNGDEITCEQIAESVAELDAELRAAGVRGRLTRWIHQPNRSSAQPDFPALIDRFWQNTRRCVGWDVQYFGTVEPQKRGAPHFHAAIRGTIPRAELWAITAATYHQVWWPHHDQLIYSGEQLPVWDTRAKAFTDPDTEANLPTWEQACEKLTEPAHVVGFGAHVHVKGILGGTEEAGRHIGYLTK